ncbi:hypothetical protein PRIPAC_90537 [Pristionchus pacificus]|nr:hypothetical protein PRIPAC_90537 [Pristionchus pacificus]|eukprot:PDM84884.1 hypothetical protein PRIPAC_33907 [Pristionchus pacificus]
MEIEDKMNHEDIEEDHQRRDNLMENDIIVIDLLVNDEKEDNRVRNNIEIEIELKREHIMMKRDMRKKRNMPKENLR